MSPNSSLLAVARFLLLLALAVPAAVPAAQDPTYQALRAARPDGRTVPVQGLVLERDVFRFQLDSGAFHLLAPVEGRTVGAVFLGQGSYRLVPATESERRHLALAVGGDARFEVLADRFETLVLLFTDDTAVEIGLHAPERAGAPDPAAVRAWEAHLDRQRKDFRTNFHLRLLRDLLNRPGLTSGAFLAFVDGKEHPPALAAVDPDGVEGMALGALMGGEDSLFFVAGGQRGGFWYLCDQKAEVDRGRKSPPKRLADALHYTLETAVARDAGLEGTAILRFQALAPGLRVLPVHLLPALRLKEAAFVPAGAGEPAWTPLAWVQEGEKEDADAAVVFPQPLPKDAQVLLRLSYGGSQVLRDAGEKNFVVGARESWYPNLGVFSDPATFDLTYRVPAGNEVVSVGRRVESRTEGKQSVAVWKAERPVQVAGFNYGRFKRLEKRDETSGLVVEVYTNPGTPDVVREINEYLRASGGVQDFGTTALNLSLGPEIRINTERLAESAAVDGINSARLFTTYFGPLRDDHVVITQQSQWTFGQSWPTLIFMPYLAFMTGTVRSQLGLAGAQDFVEQVGFHEFAHQWWGHLVGWESYRDQWLSEGFAEFSAALAVQHTVGWKSYDDFWRERRKQILERTPGAPANYEAGPITLGYRLATERSPGAAQAMIYAKGGYVLHMLRMLMWDGGAPTPDGRFIEMMKDFVATHAGKQASTADFQKAVERHMVPAMNATGDGKMDWFFGQWVHGTEIPRYTHDLKVEKSGDGWRVTGSVTQEGVSGGFRALVPLYFDLGKGELARFGTLAMIGATTKPVDVVVKPPKKPRRVLVNARGEVLARE